MAAVDLTTLAAVRQYMGGDAPTSADPLLQSLITAASVFAESYCGRSFHSADYNDTYEGTGTHRLMLRNRPVTAVASVTVGGMSWALTTTDYAPGFQFDDLGLFGTGGYVFIRGVRNIKVAYTAGYVIIPADLSQAVNELVTLKFKRRTNIDVTARQIAQETISYNVSDMPKSVRTTFDLYRAAAPL